ncbi:hypothetical protein RvY_16582 [Ramazzottius varieornatus]|uniref:Uncharacterized protein n=1 Tax=Ramazzottius varieornatus TaxID=947166 RepID=A0A1D1W095_RAMVA|nr:hypothetical protein RvY_16582 [Ramazzottius varieornatus]
MKVSLLETWRSYQRDRTNYFTLAIISLILIEPSKLVHARVDSLNHSLFHSGLDPGPETTLSTAPNGCESVRVDSSTGEINYEMSPCPEWTTEARVPAFCCGTEDGKKECCEWSTYIVNQVGFGRTSVGLLIFVGIFFVVAFIVFLSICGLFQVCVVARWERQAGYTYRRGSSRTTRRNSTICPPVPMPVLTTVPPPDNYGTTQPSVHVRSEVEPIRHFLSVGDRGRSIDQMLV